MLHRLCSHQQLPLVGRVTLVSALRKTTQIEYPQTRPVAQESDSLHVAAQTILRRFGARAVSLLASPRQLEDGRTIPPRMSANDAYVALEEACGKMARVALRRCEEEPHLQPLGFSASLDVLFPDPHAYLMRCIRSVISDAERITRREITTVSIDQPISGGSGENPLCLRDTLADNNANAQPEDNLIAEDEKQRFRVALNSALKSIPQNYLEAIRRDMGRERQRAEGVKLAPETDRERQTVCRARAALANILKRECGIDNPYVLMIGQPRSSRVRKKQTSAKSWSNEKQENLYQRLLNVSWQERAARAYQPDENIEEAVVNELNVEGNATPPSPEMRQAMRVLDLFVLDNDPRSEVLEAQNCYAQALKLRKSGKIEQALEQYRAAYTHDPKFLAAFNEVGVLLMQTGNLREALKIYLTIVEKPDAGEQKYIAANNAADVYLTWFDAGRNKDRNIERATQLARLAMEHPTPMRACNLILAYVKDRFYLEAKEVMEQVLRSNLPTCMPEKFLSTLFQIRDSDLIAWLNWLDGEMEKETTE